MEKAKPVVRISSYGDYIALDFVKKSGQIESTPFYISNGKSVECHWARPSGERCDNPNAYDDWVERWQFKMEKGKLFCKWLNGPCSHMDLFDELNPRELAEWRFEYVMKVINPMAQR